MEHQLPSVGEALGGLAWKKLLFSECLHWTMAAQKMAAASRIALHGPVFWCCRCKPLHCWAAQCNPTSSYHFLRMIPCSHVAQFQKWLLGKWWPRVGLQCSAVWSHSGETLASLTWVCSIPQYCGAHFSKTSFSCWAVWCDPGSGYDFLSSHNSVCLFLHFLVFLEN